MSCSERCGFAPKRLNVERVPILAIEILRAKDALRMTHRGGVSVARLKPVLVGKLIARITGIHCVVDVVNHDRRIVFLSGGEMDFLE
jgi:hypothetical protein